MRARKRQDLRLSTAVACSALATMGLAELWLIASHTTERLWWTVPVSGVLAGLCTACALEQQRRRVAQQLRSHIHVNLYDRGLLALCLEHMPYDLLPQLRPPTFWERPLLGAPSGSFEERISSVARHYCALCAALGLRPFPRAYEDISHRASFPGGWQAALLAATIVSPVLLWLYNLMMRPLTAAWEQEVWLCLAQAAADRQP
jgi:hypothetical protein